MLRTSGDELFREFIVFVGDVSIIIASKLLVARYHFLDLI